MTATMIIGLLGGLLLGMAHAWLIWKETHSSLLGAGLGLLRILVVGGLLFASAYFGVLLPAVCGWVISYSLTVAGFGLRKTA